MDSHPGHGAQSERHGAAKGKSPPGKGAWRASNPNGAATSAAEELDGSGQLRASIERGVASGLGEHRVEHLLNGQRVRTAARGLEEMAVAVPRIGVEGDRVGAVVAREGCGDLLQLHPIGLMRISHCLLDLADHARMHVASPPGAGTRRRYIGARQPVALASRSFNMERSVTGVGSVW